MRTIVVGAGPAGVRAVEQLVTAGLRPVWIDEAPDGGGRIYQRPPLGLTRDHRQLYGMEAGRARAVHDTLDALKSRTDWRPNTLVWHIDPHNRTLETLCAGQQATLTYDNAILCTGAMDRVIPLPGWTRPGVTTLGGAQIALKAQGCAIGQHVALVGTGPLLWLLAYQYLKNGARPVAVIDTTSFAHKARHAAALLPGGTVFWKGLWYMAAVRAAGTPVFEGARPVAITGSGDEVKAITFKTASGATRQITCDAVALGWGLKPEAQLADLAGVPFHFDEPQHNWVPEKDATGRTKVPAIYLAGDGAGIAGADAAEMAGARAALALLEDAGRTVPGPLTATLDGALARLSGFRATLERAFPFPADLARAMPDDTLVCRCEAISAGDLRAVGGRPATGAAPELNRAKAFTRLGMGRCQGRVCGPAGAEILATALGRDVAAIGRLRGQPPVKPVPLASATVQEAAE
ncbi:FAD/NAD(P)-binding oxidoreductase [Azorhizobium oxalatiphilum]|uniref:FAD/NAD(P)-binding oxidoreductase n=1 Tax=Azorhizobium oxalatiphilum TaxID=980631 RepID=A0A917CD62_9HYPH|nr:NAD(P)/FAD-dependent oxidoreductase [Azorhizobium oxalatiphilum]GGF81972.1 FAD/NAD(P)-binding oxidoreductase [Azorhizobium oxalatiphilum]